MKKLLSLLSILTISGTAVPTTIAASPYQKEYVKKINENKRHKREVFENWNNLFFIKTKIGLNYKTLTDIEFNYNNKRRFDFKIYLVNIFRNLPIHNMGSSEEDMYDLAESIIVNWSTIHFKIKEVNKNQELVLVFKNKNFESLYIKTFLNKNKWKEC